MQRRPSTLDVSGSEKVGHFGGPVGAIVPTEGVAEKGATAICRF
jgi:hypothetical protein